MRPMFLAMTIVTLWGTALTGCGLSRMADTFDRTATWGNALPAWHARARAVVLPADEAQLVPAIEAAFAEENLVLAGTVEFEGLMTTYGAPEEGGELRGCKIGRVPVEGGVTLREMCFRTVTEQRRKVLPDSTRREEYADPYLLTRIIERIEPATAAELWKADTAGKRTMECARLHMITPMMPLASLPCD